MKGRIVLFGTPAFAELAFRGVLEAGICDVPFVVTQPDRPSGRGMELTPPPVKKMAEEFGIPVFQPESLKGITFNQQLITTNTKNSALCEALNSSAPIDLLVVVAYGRIIPKALLDFTKMGALNIHGSLLPRWRGAAPIHRALAAGDQETGVCLMGLEEGLDTGPVFSKSSTPLAASDNFQTVHDRLALLGRELLLRDLPRILSRELLPVPQSEEGITYAEKWEKPDLEIQWAEPKETTLNRIRASTPFPGARTTLNGELVKIFKASEGGQVGQDLAPGTIYDLSGDRISVALTRGESLSLEELQLQGRRRLSAGDIIRGRGIKIGDVFGQ